MILNKFLTKLGKLSGQLVKLWLSHCTAPTIVVFLEPTSGTPLTILTFTAVPGQQSTFLCHLVYHKIPYQAARQSTKWVTLMPIVTL